MRTVSFTMSLTLAAIGYLGAQGAEPQHKAALMVEAREESLCNYDCAPFDWPTLYFCFDVQGQTLIGSRKADFRWKYDSSKMLRFAGKPVSLRDNDRSIWVVRTDQKEMRLDQNYSEDVFSDPRCTAEIHRHWLREMAGIKRPRSVPPEAVLVPKGPRPLFRSEGPRFWIACIFNSHANLDLCTMWNESGVKYKEMECVEGSSRKPVLDFDLLIDPLTTRNDSEIHLQNGIVLRN
jgi:hypothetical protein